MTSLNRPLVGVAAIIHDHKGNILMGQRQGSHGSGQSSLLSSSFPLFSPSILLFLPFSALSLYTSLIPHTGTYQCPGGHLEHGESFALTAAREALEETGLEVGNARFVAATNDVFKNEEGGRKHYVTIFMMCEIVGEEKVARVCCSFLLLFHLSRVPGWRERGLRDACNTNADFNQAMEPEKCAAWEWVPWTQMWDWSGEQARAEDEGKEAGRQMFLPLVNLWREFPDLKDLFVKR
jgi:8-oxo-dGTP diphosphatase